MMQQVSRKYKEPSKILSRVIRKDSLLVLPPEATVREATHLMCKYDCGAVGVVNDQESLAGLLTDGDIMRKVVCFSKNPDRTYIGDVMTRNPETIDINSDANDALRVISRQGYRYLPVMDAGKLVGILDVRDLYEEVRRIMGHTIEQKDLLLSYMFGEAYGSTARPVFHN